MEEKTIVFDTSSIISLVTNNLLCVLDEIREKFEGEFMITNDVYKEVVLTPLNSKKYKFEAMVVNNTIERGILKLAKNVKLDTQIKQMLKLTNSIYKTSGKNLEIFHKGEISSLVLALNLESDAIVTDERSMRLVLEDPKRLAKILSKKLHVKVKIERGKLKEFRSRTKKISVLRSTELALVAYEMGALDKYMFKNDRKQLLDGILWGLKLRGCTISPQEINEFVAIEESNPS